MESLQEWLLSKAGEQPLDDHPEASLRGWVSARAVDALAIAARDGDRVVPRAAPIVSGVRTDVRREPPGIRGGDSNFPAAGSGFLEALKARGLQGSSG